MITKEKIETWENLKNKIDIVTISGLAPAEKFEFFELSEELKMAAEDICGEIVED